MLRRPISVLGLGLLGLFALALRPAPEDQLKPADHDALGKRIAAYLEANEKTSGTDKALAEVNEQLEKIRKKVDRDPLSLTGDLGKSLWASFDYVKAGRNLKRGAVKEMTCPKPLVDDDPKAVLTYSLWIPSKYEAKKAYPLLLIIPDKGEKPSIHITDKWTDAGLRDGAAIAAVTMPEGDTATWTEVAARDNEGKLKDGGISNVLATLADIRRQVALDYDRVYVVGWGEGVRVAAALGARFPDRFAGVIGRSGDVPETLTIEPFRNLPSFFGGAGGGATAFHDKLTEAKYDNCTLKPDAKESDVWAWIQDHPRISNPTEIVINAAPNTSVRSYWVQLSPFDAPVQVKANVDRGTNTITIDAEGATELTLYLNDQLVDLDKEIKFSRNGVDHVELVRRNLSTTLGLIVKSISDPGKLYVATRKIDIPAKPKPRDKPKDSGDKPKDN